MHVVTTNGTTADIAEYAICRRLSPAAWFSADINHIIGGIIWPRGLELAYTPVYTPGYNIA